MMGKFLNKPLPLHIKQHSKGSLQVYVGAIITAIIQTNYSLKKLATMCHSRILTTASKTHNELLMSSVFLLMPGQVGNIVM